MSTTIVILEMQCIIIWGKIYLCITELGLDADNFEQIIPFVDTL